MTRNTPQGGNLMFGMIYNEGPISEYHFSPQLHWNIRITKSQEIHFVRGEYITS